MNVYFGASISLLLIDIEQEGVYGNLLLHHTNSWEQ